MMRWMVSVSLRPQKGVPPDSITYRMTPSDLPARLSARRQQVLCIVRALEQRPSGDSLVCTFSWLLRIVVQPRADAAGAGRPKPEGNHVGTTALRTTCHTRGRSSS